MSWISTGVEEEHKGPLKAGDDLTAAMLGEELAALQYRPELAHKYAHFLAGVDENRAVPARLTELLQRRIRCIHGLALAPAVVLSEAQDKALQAGDVAAFSALEQAVLRVAEQMPYAHDQIDDETLAQLTHELGAEAVVVLLVAAAFYDVNCRLALCLS
ncbi:MAG: hypothetical protein RIC89_17000 [Pseudomonadales bacterium]